MEEEQARVKLGWMLWDRKIWSAAFGDEMELLKHVAPPSSFMQHGSSCVIGMSDQISIWVKIGRSKQVYCSEERPQKKVKKASDSHALQLVHEKEVQRRGEQEGPASAAP
eukprot:3801308-Heterocapsa_arctica.AAC.1